MNINVIRFLDRKLGDLMISSMSINLKPPHLEESENINALDFGSSRKPTNQPQKVFLMSRIRKLKPVEVKNPSKILVIKIWGIGSLVNLSPSIDKLKKLYPKARIDLLTSTPNVPIYKNLFYKTYSFDMSKKIFIFWDMFRTVLALRRNNYDLVFDFEPLARSTAIFSRIISPKKSIGFDLFDGNRKKMFTNYVLYDDKNKHISSIFYDLVSDKKRTAEKLRLLEPKISEKEKHKVEQFLLQNKIKKYLCININSSELALQRRWDPKKFNELSRLISQKFPDYHQLYVGGPNDWKYVNSNMKDIGSEKIINIAGKFNLLETTFLFKKSRLLITNDSGPLHLAAAAGCPIITFFGPETPKLYAPLTHKAKIFYKNLACSPCINIRNAKKTHCTNPKCLDFSVKEVFDAVKLVIKN